MNNKLAYFNSRCLFIGIGISYILDLTGTSFWISCLIGTILGVLMLLLIKKTNDSMWIKKITGLFFIIVTGSILINMGRTLYLENTPSLVLTIFSLLSAFIISRGKKENMKGAFLILFIYSLFLFFSKIGGLAPQVHMDEMLPMFNTDIKRILWGSIAYALLGVVPILSLNDLSDKKNIIIYYLVGSITVTTVSFLVATVLGLNEAKVIRYPEYAVLKRIKFLNFISNVDHIFNFALIVDLILTMAAGYRNIECHNNYLNFILVVITIFIVNTIVNNNWLIMILYVYLPYILLFLLFLLLLPKKNKYKKVTS